MEPAIKPPEYGEFTDPRDGKTYRTVKIGKQVWLAENLAYVCEGSEYCLGNPRYAERFGCYYDWETAKKAVPPGWHLPTIKEFIKFHKTVGDNACLMNDSGWNFHEDCPERAFNSGFSAVGAGYNNTEKFEEVGINAGFWSTTVDKEDKKYAECFSIYSCSKIFFDANQKIFKFSVRCVKDTEGA